MTLFSIKNLFAGYRSFTVLHDISISVESGEFISIIGPNGAGKSTLIKVLSNNIPHESGTVFFKGRDIKSIDRKIMAAEISVVHQSMENILPFTVYDFLLMGRFPHQGILDLETPDDIEAVEKSMSITGILHLRDRRLTKLSGGEKQLARIAQALSQSSSVIILDEPISHLDISHSIQIMDILYQLNQGGTTIITVLHDINLAAAYCSRIIGLKNGRVFFDGIPSEVVTYRNIEELFDTTCVVYENPMTGKPYVFPVPGYVKEKRNDS